MALLPRHAEVEALFWQLDPAGRGFIGAHDLHIHLQKHQPTNEAGASQPTASPPSPQVQYRSSLRVDEKKFFDALQDKLPNVLAACRSVDPAKTGCISRGDFIWALRQGGLILSHADATSVIATLSSRKDGVVLYHTIADSVAAVLQLPGANNQSTAKKTNRHHLTNTAVLLDQQAAASIEPATTPSETLKQPAQDDYPARRSSLKLGYDYDQEPGPGDLTANLLSNASLHHVLSEPEKLERVLRQRHARRVLLIQNILERRSDLKMCFDMMPYRQTPHGLVLLTVDEIADILTCARMNIPLKTPDEAKTLLREIVPPNLDQLSTTIRTPSSSRRQNYALSPATCEVSIRAKLLQFSTLKDVSVMQWNTTGAIIVRHAFKGLSRDTVAVASTGTFDALCRNVDLKHICTRLALDLTQTELNFLVSKMPTTTTKRPPAKLVYKAKNELPLVTPKESSNMNRSTSGIAGVLDSLKGKIDILDHEIKADQKGKKDYEDELFKLNTRKQDLTAHLTECQRWIDLFASKIQPLENSYSATTVDMRDEYNEAKVKHANGLQVLIDNFNYHPVFKRYNDDFTAVPFRPT
ncbi:hypothetical protein DYB34_011018 [Aphanomyces astaci]|uniref:EF-hand domain-containing protein n=1 Tax=Aphanomyces astaci TaxID=112090 RepID=A0A3R6WD74_APHAT|nr:hypothetical protein DYB34_011018 [Aphanomyces astaci]